MVLAIAPICLRQIKQKSERQLKEATKRITELESEVATFIQKMGKMERSLKEYEQRRLRDKNEWETRENRYKEKLRELNQQPNGVPMSLFKLIKDESESRKLEIQRLRKKSAELESTLLQWEDGQPKAISSQMQSKEDLAATVSQHAYKGNVNTIRSRDFSSSKIPSSQSSVSMAAFKKNLVVQTKAPREMDFPESAIDENTPAPPVQPARELIDWVFSGTQVSPHGSKKIKVATIPIRDTVGSDTRTRDKRRAQVASNIEGEERKNGPVLADCQAASKPDKTKHLISGRLDKENHGNKVSFSFPTPDEKKGQTGHKLRLKMVREAGGRKGLLQKLEKVRSPRSMCSLDEKAA